MFTPPARGVGPTILNGLLILLPRTAFAASFGPTVFIGFFTPARAAPVESLAPAISMAAQSKTSASIPPTRSRASAATQGSQGIPGPSRPSGVRRRGKGDAQIRRVPLGRRGWTGAGGTQSLHLQFGAFLHFLTFVATVAPVCETVDFFCNGKIGLEMRGRERRSCNLLLPINKFEQI